VPEAGRRELEGLDLDRLFTSDLTRRAARHLTLHLDRPGEELPAGDDDFARLIASLVIRAGELQGDPAALRLERLQLEQIRLDREIAAARERGEPIGAIAAERQRIHEEIRHRFV
jgi:hypothetical protein